MRSRRGGREVGSTCPPSRAPARAFCELPMSPEADTGAGWSGDLRETWESCPKGN